MRNMGEKISDILQIGLINMITQLLTNSQLLLSTNTDVYDLIQKQMQKIRFEIGITIVIKLFQEIKMSSIMVFLF